MFESTYIALGSRDPLPFRTPLENIYYEFIPFGSDNLFPQALALFARTSPNHRGIINSKLQYIIGDGIIPQDEKDKETLALIEKINFEGENLTDVTTRVLTDDLMGGNLWLEIITDRNRSFLYISQMDFTKCRLAKDLKRVIMHQDWKNYTGENDTQRKVLPLYPNFQKDNDGLFPAYRSVFHYKRYEPEFTYYGVPQYVSGQDSIQIDLKTNKWNLARLKNAFSISGVLVIPVKDKAESKAVIDNIKANHIGEENQGKLFTITKKRPDASERGEQTQLIQTNQQEDGSWEKLHNQSMSDMVIAHSWFRSLVGIADNTGFDTQRILNEYEIALNTVITNYQREYIGIYRKLFSEVLGRDLPIQFKNRGPLQDERYYKIWEIRKMRGMDYDEKDPAQQQIVGVKSPGTNIQVT